jgi:hypothetical protein
MAAEQERGDRIRALKLSRPDLTWRRIADYVGVTERSATDWQKTGGIDYDNAKKLAKLFEVDLDFLWRGPVEEERAPSPFAGQDALADRFDELQRQVTDQLEEHARKVEELLARQSTILARIEEAIGPHTQAAERIEAAVAQQQTIKNETDELLPLIRDLLDGRPQATREDRPADSPQPAPAST